MTKKDYILIAGIIKKEAEAWQANSLQARAIDRLASAFAEELAKHNPRFNHQKFIAACMPE